MAMSLLAAHINTYQHTADSKIHTHLCVPSAAPQEGPCEDAGCSHGESCSSSEGPDFTPKPTIKNQMTVCTKDGSAAGTITGPFDQQDRREAWDSVLRQQ